MSRPIYVDAYSGYKANERPRQFCLDEDVFEIQAVEEQWRSTEATFFKVKTTDGKHYVLRYDERLDQWTLQGDFDGAELFARPSIEVVTVESKTIRDSESRIVGFNQKFPKLTELSFLNWSVLWNHAPSSSGSQKSCASPISVERKICGKRTNDGLKNDCRAVPGISLKRSRICIWTNQSLKVRIDLPS
jgi:hypothetical protein